MSEQREDRLRTLAHQFLPEVANYLTRHSYLLTPSDVDDLTEEVLVIAWRRLDDITEGSELPWMIGVARNLLNNARRKHTRRRVVFSRLVPLDDLPSVEDQVVANEQLRRAFLRLSARDQEILFLHHWEGLDVNSLAIALSLSAGATKARLSRATVRLHRGFDDSLHVDVSTDLGTTRTV
jgi:RNA polymerase sigma factor (sigma-70 family)